MLIRSKFARVVRYSPEFDHAYMASMVVNRFNTTSMMKEMYKVLEYE